MIPLTGFRGTRVGVLGLGRSGLATARALRAGGAEAVCWDDGAAARAAAEAEGFTVADPCRAGALDDMAALVVSPGIPHLHPAPHPAIAAAWEAGVAVDNDIGLFFAHMQAADLDDFAGSEGPEARIVAVTGSNGKSTTTALIAHLLNAAGRVAVTGGNIGTAVLALDPPQPGSVVVLELSSYQIELARSLAPDIAVFLNLSPDHLDRHGGIGGYFAAKRRLFEQGAPERSVIGVDDVHGRFLAATQGADTITISSGRRLRGAAWSVFMARGHLSEWRDGKQIASIDLRTAPGLPGAHNHQNACAAYAVARALGIAPRRIEAGLMSFHGLAHRLERVGTVRGVACYNDSKATNADAAEKALLAFERIRWIAGGQGKEGGIALLAPLFGRIAHAYLIGRDAAAFAGTLGDTPHSLCADLETATARAVAEAEPGDVILLSPAAASFDQFADFEARGTAFRALLAPHLDPRTETGP
jgi:UDP-N-acetylmuramoylalanine--D-glutamate ligase